MGRPRSAGVRAWLTVPFLTAPFLAAAAACHSAPAKVWNLEQLHEPDGTPRHRGQLEGDIEYALTQFFRTTNFGGPEFQERTQKDERIDDPLGECLENVRELGLCRRDEKNAGLQAATFAWLVADCTSVLSRERCALELGALASDLQLSEHLETPAGEPVGADAIKEALDALVPAAQAASAKITFGGSTLSDACARVAALPVDRAGALRLLRATNQLLGSREGGAELAPLRELRLTLARRTTALAVRAALQDPHGRVRAAALDAGVRAFPGERDALLRGALLATLEPSEPLEARTEYSLRALELVSAHGLPVANDAAETRAWIALLQRVLELRIDGPHDAAACRALARVTGDPATLRPEVWLTRLRAAGASRDPAAPVPGAGP